MKCPCGLKKEYNQCCGRFISGKNQPGTPEQLMRSRYTAYTKAKTHYIAGTMLPTASPNFDADEAAKWAKQVKWHKLSVLESSINGSIGFVEFAAYYFEDHKRHTIHELSEFHLVHGRWLYIKGLPPKHTL